MNCTAIFQLRDCCEAAKITSAADICISCSLGVLFCWIAMLAAFVLVFFFCSFLYRNFLHIILYRNSLHIIAEFNLEVSAACVSLHVQICLFAMLPATCRTNAFASLSCNFGWDVMISASAYCCCRILYCFILTLFWNSIWILFDFLTHLMLKGLYHVYIVSVNNKD